MKKNLHGVGLLLFYLYIVSFDHQNNLKELSTDEEESVWFGLLLFGLDYVYIYHQITIHLDLDLSEDDEESV